MNVVNTVVIGAGHSGLAMSRRLTERSIDHVVLERGRPGNSWRTQRWDSLRMLTPNWMVRLPGWSYSGADVDGFLAAPQVADLVTAYAASSAAPVITDTTVTAVRAGGTAFRVDSDRGRWTAANVVLAAGATTPTLPSVAAGIPGRLARLAATDYRNPEQLPDGGVLVVGASASGVQIAEELHRSGRPVTLAVGEHVRLPRRYRGRDILWWLDALGILGQRWDRIDDVTRVRRLPSPQLVGGERSVDLNALSRLGVELVGRLVSVRDGRVQFSGSLANTVTLADLKLQRLLTRIDDHCGGVGEPAEPTRLPAPRLERDLRSGEIRSVVWATGVAPDHSWLNLPIFDRRGRIRHHGGVVEWPGLYVLGLPTLRTRRSTYLDGARDDTRDLADHLYARLAGRRTLSNAEAS